MNQNENNTIHAVIDANEFSVADKEAEIAKNEAGDGAYTYTHKFRKPFTYMHKTYDELRFDWDSLIGLDGLAVEAELQAIGTPVVAPEFSGAYQLRIAAKACTEKIGADAFELMSLNDTNKIRRAARSFLLM